MYPFADNLRSRQVDEDATGPERGVTGAAEREIGRVAWPNGQNTEFEDRSELMEYIKKKYERSLSGRSCDSSFSSTDSE